MELMSGLPMFIQLGILFLSSLFISISYGTGTWWTNTHLDYEMNFSLWRLCSHYVDHEKCLSLTGNYLESVIMALRGCMGVCIICLIILIILHGIHFISWKRSPTSDDHFIHARTAMYLLFAIFSIAALAHSHHCPPCYFVGKSKMAASVAWGWYLSLVAFILLWFPTGVHCYTEFIKWRTGK